jgi:hypothetical protein
MVMSAAMALGNMAWAGGVTDIGSKQALTVPGAGSIDAGEVLEGQRYWFEASGLVGINVGCPGGPCSQADPDGRTVSTTDGTEAAPQEADARFPCPGLATHSLVGRIGASSDGVQLGREGSFVAPASGRLVLLCNDLIPGDNSGAWVAVIRGEPRGVGRGDQVAPQLRVELDLVDGSRVIGTPSIDSVAVETPYAKMDVQLKQILTLRIGKDRETATLELRNGDKLKGVVDLGALKLNTVFGKVKIGAEHIKGLRVMLSGGALPATLKDGLVLRYSFDRDEGGEVADQSGRSNDGKVRGAKWTSQGKVGGAYRFSGGTDHILVDCPALRKSSSDRFSVAVWFYAEALNPNDENTVFGISAPRGVNDGAFSYRIGLGRPNGQGTDFALGFTPGTWCRDNSVSPFMLGLKEKQWYHAVGVYDKGDIRLYVNGEEEGRTTYSLGAAGPSVMNEMRESRGASEMSSKPGAAYRSSRSLKSLPYLDGPSGPTPAATALMGCIGNSVGMFESRGFNGTIDELMFFDRALTEDEVKHLYSAQK